MKNTITHTQDPQVLQEINLHISGVSVCFSNEKTIYLPKQETLLLADFHLGKAEHFRKNGISVPTETTNESIKKMAGQLHQYNPKTVIFLGDLFHSIENESTIKLKAFLANYPTTSFLLVLGNHDILPQVLYTEMGLKTFTEPFHFGPFQLSHHPPASTPADKICVFGHIHPAIRLKGKGRQYLKLPCFHISENCITMPAFGGFTGTSIVRAAQNDTILACSTSGIFKIS